MLQGPQPVPQSPQLFSLASKPPFSVPQVPTQPHTALSGLMKLLWNNRVDQQPKQWFPPGPTPAQSMAHDHKANHWRIIHQWFLNHCHLQLLLHHTDMDQQSFHFDLSQLSHYPLLKIGQHQPINIPVRIFLQGDAPGLWSTTSTSSACPRLRPHSCLTGTSLSLHEAHSPHLQKAEPNLAMLHKEC